MRYKILTLFFVVCLLMGCAAMQVRQSLPKGTRIGVLSMYSNDANFKHIGTTMFQNQQYKHSLPNLNLNSKITKRVCAVLKQYGYMGIDVNAMQLDLDKLAVNYGLGFRITEYGKSYLKRLQSKYHVNYLLLIQPDGAYFGRNKEDYLLSLWGYGLYYRSFFGMKYVYAAGGYRIYLIDVNNYRLLAQQLGETERKIRASVWKDKYAKMSKEDLRGIVSILGKEIPAAISTKVQKMLGLS